MVFKSPPEHFPLDMPHSLRILRAIALLLFTFSVLFFILVALADIAPRKARVFDPQHQVIGSVSIPPNDGLNFLVASGFLILSGMQLWTTQAIIRVQKSLPDPGAK